ncbi:NAD(P)-binding protein [Plenodomus tracheiphilus IPT5]|uniref:NAD(P)-binding protein n=1 Tax=Plenodomus tracheiphilus IPT5 TaxID=1408161 RepID=A0A6A7AQB2_9PLEO|nr:NAD(P)-binding protein [Plenodomus tracheiphilus IPT5]
MADWNKLLEDLQSTDLTKIYHHKPYPSISVTRPELSQAGRAILITGGGTGAGFGIAMQFVRASASTIIIVGRRLAVLQTARAQLQEEVKRLALDTNIIAQGCDITKKAEVDALWTELSSRGIIVDVYVANAAKFTEPKPLLELGTDEVWSQLEANVRWPLCLTEKFVKQAAGRQKFIVSISSAVVHNSVHPETRARPAYVLSKSSGTLLFQLLAQDHTPEELQIINLHPGLVFNSIMKDLGADPELFDSVELVGSFAVWAATKEAAFLHGRFVWCSWDVDELATGEMRKRIEEDPYYLRCSVVGLRGNNAA